MKKDDVKIGSNYLCKVTDKVVVEGFDARAVAEGAALEHKTSLII